MSLLFKDKKKMAETIFKGMSPGGESKFDEKQELMSQVAEKIMFSFKMQDIALLMEAMEQMHEIFHTFPSEELEEEVE